MQTLYVNQPVFEKLVKRYLVETKPNIRLPGVLSRVIVPITNADEVFDEINAKPIYASTDPGATGRFTIHTVPNNYTDQFVALVCQRTLGATLTLSAVYVNSTGLAADDVSVLIQSAASYFVMRDFPKVWLPPGSQIAVEVAAYNAGDKMAAAGVYTRRALNAT